MIHFGRLAAIIAAVAACLNLAITVTSDAQTGWDDLNSAVQRIEARQIASCP